jgi:hypothetical protein
MCAKNHTAVTPLGHNDDFEQCLKAVLAKITGTDTEKAAALGLSRSTLIAWRDRGEIPRAAQVAFRVAALYDKLVDRQLDPADFHESRDELAKVLALAVETLVAELAVEPVERGGEQLTPEARHPTSDRVRISQRRSALWQRIYEKVKADAPAAIDKAIRLTILAELQGGSAHLLKGALWSGLITEVERLEGEERAAQTERRLFPNGAPTREVLVALARLIASERAFRRKDQRLRGLRRMRRRLNKLRRRAARTKQDIALCAALKAKMAEIDEALNSLTALADTAKIRAKLDAFDVIGSLFTPDLPADPEGIVRRFVMTEIPERRVILPHGGPFVVREGTVIAPKKKTLADVGAESEEQRELRRRETLVRAPWAGFAWRDERRPVGAQDLVVFFDRRWRLVSPRWGAFLSFAAVPTGMPLTDGSYRTLDGVTRLLESAGGMPIVDATVPTPDQPAEFPRPLPLPREDGPPSPA